MWETRETHTGVSRDRHRPMDPIHHSESIHPSIHQSARTTALVLALILLLLLLTQGHQVALAGDALQVGEDLCRTVCVDGWVSQSPVQSKP